MRIYLLSVFMFISTHYTKDNLKKIFKKFTSASYLKCLTDFFDEFVINCAY